MDYNHDFRLRLRKTENLTLKNYSRCFHTLTSMIINGQWSSMIIQYCRKGIITDRLWIIIKIWYLKLDWENWSPRKYSRYFYTKPFWLQWLLMINDLQWASILFNGHSILLGIISYWLLIIIKISHLDLFNLEIS